MTRECASCGLRSCDGVACYLADPEPVDICSICCGDLDDGVCRNCEADLRLTETHGDPMLKKRRAA